MPRKASKQSKAPKQTSSSSSSSEGSKLLPSSSSTSANQAPKQSIFAPPKAAAAAAAPNHRDAEEAEEAGGEEAESPRPLQDLWKEAFPVGTEWDQYDKVYDINWDFSHLEKAFEKGGMLSGQKAFLFGCTEPQFISHGDVSKVVHIPAVVVVVAPCPPSDKIGIKSVQMEGESIISMREMKMDWVPYIPNYMMDYVSVEKYKANIFTLKCVQRRVALRNLKEERLKKYEYCLPYFNNPFKEEELEPDTSVSIMYPFDDGKPPIVAEFDWDMDDLEEFVESYVTEEIITAEEKPSFKEFVKQKVSAERKQQREAKAARQKKIEEMSAETRAFYDNIKFYKFYPLPSPGTPDISALKSPFINRYYGKANEVL